MKTNQPVVRVIWVRSVLLVSLGAAATLIVLAIGAIFAFGSVQVAIAYLRGERLVPYPRVVDIGEVSPGERTQVRFSVHNLSDRPVKLVGGGASNCPCLSIPGLPVTVASGDSIPVAVDYKHLSPRSAPREFAENVNIYNDLQGNRPLVVRIIGTTSEESSERAEAVEASL